MSILKKIAARLPDRWQTELKRIYYGIQITKGVFKTDEPEYQILKNLIKSGDWVIDIGANVGHYTKRFSELVGPTGRVIAFEPVPTTFFHLSSNVMLFTYSNVTLINAAVSDNVDLVGMSIPKFSSGMDNYYQAHLSDAAGNGLSVLTLSIDLLLNNKRIALIKVDAEGHESFVIAGMQELLKKHHPILIIETGSKTIVNDLLAMGYESEKLKNSPNVLFMPKL